MKNRLGMVTVHLDAAWILKTPARVDERSVLVLAMHGYGSNPEVMLRLTAACVGENSVIASLRGPNQHYLATSPAGDEVGYNWGTRAHSELNIRLHHQMVRAVAGELRGRFSIPARRTMLVGFSQPVGLNYRLIGTYPDEAGGVVGICGGVPKDWEEDKYHRVAAPILHISRSEDEFFPADVARGFPERLRKHADDVEFHLSPGGHRFPSRAAPLVRDWMKRVFP